MRSSRANLSGLTAAAAAVCACLCILAAPAGAAVTTYPDGGSGFNTDAEGWTPGEASCTPAELLCSPESTYSSTTGNPPGSIAEETTVTLNAVSLFRGTETWISPRFAVPAGTVSGAMLSLDRAFDPGGLVDVAPTATYVVTLADLTNGTSATLLSEGLTVADTAFATRSAPATVTPGHAYRISIQGTTAQSTLALSTFTGTTAIRFDNVGLRVQGSVTGAGGNGGAGSPGSNGERSTGGAIVSAGVQIVRGPLSAGEISKLVGSLNVNAEVGHHQGGSLVAPSKCTIIGTSGRDRILGTKGNDVICGLGGNDVIKGRGGRDVIDGGSANDKLIGGAKNDLVLGLGGRDRVAGSAGNDRLGGGAGNDLITGGAGKDLLVGRRGVDRLYGGAGPDRLKARDHGRDVVRGGGGHDVAFVDRVDRHGIRGVERMK